MKNVRIPTALIIVTILDVIVLGLVIVLFKFLNSEASIEGTDEVFGKWQAGGALAGFIIVMLLQLYVYKRFSPKGAEAHPSYPAVFGFYDSLQQEDYEKAWLYLLPETQQNRWKNGVQQFKDGFKNTQSIKLLAINFVTEDSPYSHEWVVYYQDKTESPVLPGLEKIGDWNVREIPNLDKKIDALRKKMTEKEINPAPLDKMKISEMVTAIRGDILRWRITDIDGENKANELLATSKTVSRLVGKRVTAGLHNNKWYVDHIADIPYNEE